MHPLLKNTESFESTRIYVDSLVTRAINNPFVSTDDLAFESLFSTIANRFKYGTHGMVKKEVIVPSPAEFAKIHNEGYMNIRTLVIPVAPGFSGNLSEFITLARTQVEALKVLPKELKAMRAVFASVLNESNLLENQTGNKIVKEIRGIDPSVLVKMKTYFKPNMIKEAQFGKIYPNVVAWDNKYSSLKSLVREFQDIDFLAITNLANGFSTIIDDFNRQTKQAGNRNLSSLAVREVSQAVESLATAVTISAVLQSTLVEVIEAVNGEVSKLEAQITLRKSATA